MCDLTVIYYHDIVEKGKGNSYQKVEIQKFEEQMKYLSDNGYKTLLFEDLDKPLKSKSVLVTFDDGFKTVYNRAVPVMRKYGIKGNVFLPTKYVEEGDEHFMTWDMLKELCGKNEFSVAAHTHTHKDIRTLDRAAMAKETEQNNSLIYDRLGIKAEGFCMPYGKYDSKSIKLLKELGKYKYIYTSLFGSVSSKNLTDRLLPRIGISNNDTIEIFEQKLNGKLNWKGYLQKVRLIISNLRGERITQYDIE